MKANYYRMSSSGAAARPTQLLRRRHVFLRLVEPGRSLVWPLPLTKNKNLIIVKGVFFTYISA